MIVRNVNSVYRFTQNYIPEDRLCNLFFNAVFIRECHSVKLELFNIFEGCILCDPVKFSGSGLYIILSRFTVTIRGLDW